MGEVEIAVEKTFLTFLMSASKKRTRSTALSDTKSQQPPIKKRKSLRLNPDYKNEEEMDDISSTEESDDFFADDDESYDEDESNEDDDIQDFDRRTTKKKPVRQLVGK